MLFMEILRSEGGLKFARKCVSGGVAEPTNAVIARLRSKTHSIVL
jgi:hypothetical protein